MEFNTIINSSNYEHETEEKNFPIKKNTIIQKKWNS